MPDSHFDTAALRHRLIAAREAMPEAERARHSTQIAGHLAGLLARLPAQRLGFCWPYRAEPDLRQSVADWLAADTQRSAALPVVVDHDAPLVFRAWQPGCAMQTDRYGIPVPVTDEILLPELLLIPLNGFDARGYRIGYGGGYFDRTLAIMPPPLAIGYAFEQARLPHIAEAAHDRPVDWLVTEAGVFRALRA